MKVYIRNSETTINYNHPEKNEYFEAAQVHYIVEKNNKLRVVSSYGSLGIELDSAVQMVSDQSGKSMGVGIVVGIRCDNIILGVMPKGSTQFWVCK